MLPFWDGFWRLHGARRFSPSGLPGSIPETEFVAFFANNEQDDADERELFYRLVSLLDAVYLSWSREESRKKKK